MFSAFNPSNCTHLEQWAADCAAPGEQSWTSCRSRDANPQPWVTSGFKSNAYPLGHDCLIYSHIIETKMMLYKIDFKIENRQIIYLTEHKLETCQQQTGRTQEHNHQFIRMPCTAG